MRLAGRAPVLLNQDETRLFCLSRSGLEVNLDNNFHVVKLLVIQVVPIKVGSEERFCYRLCNFFFDLVKVNAMHTYKQEMCYS